MRVGLETLPSILLYPYYHNYSPELPTRIEGNNCNVLAFAWQEPGMVGNGAVSVQILGCY